jgi:hypothetical protein
MPYLRGIDAFAFPLAESAIGYVTVFVPMLIWHVVDFTHDYRGSSSLAKLMHSYKFLAGLLGALCLSIVLATSRVLNDLGCLEVDLPEGVYQFDGCGSWTPAWKTWLMTSIWLAICLLALWKAATSIS